MVYRIIVRDKKNNVLYEFAQEAGSLDEVKRDAEWNAYNALNGVYAVSDLAFTYAVVPA